MDAGEPTDTPLDDVAYLARSPHRVDVLETLADGDRTRAELREATGIIQPTLGRVLAGFEDRGWVTRDGAGISLTAVGGIIAAEFTALLDVVERTRPFREFADLLPLDDIDVDPRWFADATVTVPTATDAMAHLRREEELGAAADHVQVLCAAAFPPHIRAYRDRVAAGEQAFEAVVTADALAAATGDPATASLVGDLAAAASLHRYDGDVPCMLGVFDDVALLLPLDDTGAPCAAIESTADAVRAWVRDEIADRREAATRVDPGMLTP